MTAAEQSSGSGHSGRLSIVLDAMGGDFSPKNEVEGALLAVQETKGRFKVILVGVREDIERELLSEAGVAWQDANKKSSQLVLDDAKKLRLFSFLRECKVALRSISPPHPR